MMEGAIGVKTGFTGKAGYCFVGAVKREDKTLVSVVLACGWPNNKTYKWTDTKKLMNYGLTEFETKSITREEIELPDIFVINGTTDRAGICAEEFESFSMLLRKDEVFTYCYELPEAVYAPVKTGDRIGTLYLMVDEERVSSCALVATETVPRADYPYYMQETWKLFFRLGNLIKKCLQIE